MASMPTYHVSVGPFTLLNQQFGAANFKAAYDAVLNPAKDQGPPLGSGPAAATLQQRAARRVGAGNLKRGQATHFLNDWLGKWWPNLAVADTLQRGMHEAIQCAAAANGGAGLPMEFVWVCLADRIFEVYFSEGPRQVTVLILTPPPPPQYDSGPLVAPENLWVVKRRDSFDDAYSTVNGTPPGLVPAPTSLGPTSTPPPGEIIKRQIWHA